MLEINALGNFTIRKNGRNLDSFGSSKVEAILVYLAMEGGQHSRGSLAAMFWPESSNTNAFASLRVALSALRKFVGDYLEISRESLMLKEGMEIYLDTQDFERQINCGNLVQALTLYRGELLAGTHIHDSNKFEDWRRWESERLLSLLINALQQDISGQITLGKYQTCQEHAAELIKLDPFNETAHRHAMIAFAMDGNRTAALKQYQRCRQILRDELEIAPSAETENLKNQITEGNLTNLAQLLTPKNTLPHPRTSFIGRELEITEIVSLLKNENCRLLTITGPGGAGKTRLAQVSANQTLAEFPDGTFFVPLEGVPTQDFLIPTIAESLQFGFDNFVHKADSLSQLIDYLRNRSLLIILDGYEHLIGKKSLLADFLEHTAGLKLMVTSRQNLNIQGEWVHHLKGLSIHPEECFEQLDISDSLTLFSERAHQANPSLIINLNEKIAALRICELVEGLPLGIELAAAWTAILSCAEIAVEIENSYDFLTSPNLDVSERHRSLRATFNYSWQMMDEFQQVMLKKLTVFHGGFTRQAAMHVAEVELVSLISLLNKSLLQKRSDGRIEMHRIIHQFSLEKLNEFPETLQKIQENHSQYFISFLQQRESALDNEIMISAREEIRQEIENLRAAMDWAVNHWKREAALNALYSYFAFYLVHGWHEGVIAFDQLSASIQTENQKPDLDNPIYLSCQAHLGWFYSNLGMVEESELISNKCISPLQNKRMDREVSLCLHNLGVNAEFRGEYRLSKQLLEEAIEVGATDRFVAYPSYFLWLGYVNFLFGEYQSGMENFKKSYALFSEHGNSWAASFALSKMGLAADGLGDHPAAMEYFKEAYQIFIETGDITGQAYSLSRMSIGAYFLEEFEQAAEFGRQALELFSGIGHRWGICTSLCRLGFAYLGEGSLLEAKARFLQAIKLSMDAHLAPLSLYALAGIASFATIKGDLSAGLDLFQYVAAHPKTPALYIDVASRWFLDNQISITTEETSEDDLAPLTEILEGVLEKFVSI